MSLIKETEDYVLKVIKNLRYDLEDVKLEVSGRRELGQFQLNEVFLMKLSKICIYFCLTKQL